MFMSKVLLRVAACAALWTYGCTANDDDSCTSPTMPQLHEVGQSLLQTKREGTAPSYEKQHSRYSKHQAKREASAVSNLAVKQSQTKTKREAMPEHDVSQKHEAMSQYSTKLLSQKVESPPATCQLPEGAKWCEVRLTNLQPYYMAVYDGSVNQDWVSWNICNKGFWEDQDMSGFGPPGSMLDIGGNIGYHTFAFAQAGFTTHTFEPMAPNLAMIRATMCRNPTLAAKITLHPHGLGTSSQYCTMMAPIDNVGDGFTKCGADGEIPMPANTFKEVGSFRSHRLDLVLQKAKVAVIDVVKIDVEGYEYQVFAGAPNFLMQYHPRVIKSELWAQMVGSTGVNYLSMFETAGYGFFSDSGCTIPMDDAKTQVARGGLDVVMCPKSPA